MTAHKSFPAIEGMRALFNLWIVGLHQHMMQKCFLAVYNRVDLLETLSASVWPGIVLGNGYQVDVFFMLSAFLFTWSMIQPSKPGAGNGSWTGNLRKILLFVVKRVLRLWPVLIAVLALAAAVNDYGARDLVAIFKTLLIPTYFDEIPQAAVPGWSNRTDIECCVAVFLVITVLQGLGWMNPLTALAAVPLSLTPKALRFLADPDAFSYMRLAADVLTTAITIPQVRQEYYRDVLYKGQVPWFNSLDTIPRMTPLFFGEYIVTHQRWSPAFVGFAVAVCLQSAHQHCELSKGKTTVSTAFTTLKRVLSRVVSFFALLVSILLATMPILMALNPATAEVRSTVLSNPPIEADFVVSVLGRTLNAVGWGYLLYRCLLPKGHPLLLNYLASFLELPLFQYIGRHTYCIYMLHYMIVHFVAFSFLSPGRMEAIVGPLSAETLLSEFLLRWLASYAITLLLAIPIVTFVEQPLLAVLQRGMRRLEVGPAKSV
jgi:peptidoglycan/LPS O-acetylase OafA/YrhL